MTDPILLRTICAEVQKVRQALVEMTAIEERVAFFAVKLDELPALRAQDMIRPLLQASILGDELTDVVERVETVAEAGAHVESAPSAESWKDWLYAAPADHRFPATADKPKRQIEVRPKPALAAKRIPTDLALPVGRDSIQLHENSRTSEGVASPPLAPLQQKPDLTIPYPAPIQSASGGVSSPLPNSVETRPLPTETTREDAVSAAWVAPATANGGIVQLLLRTIGRAERAVAQRREWHSMTEARSRFVEQVELPERAFTPARPLTPAESETLRSPAPPIFPSGTGLRRLASLATASITPVDPLQFEGSVSIATGRATPWNPVGQLPFQMTEDDFATRLFDTLRAEAARHGIDPEGLA